MPKNISLLRILIELIISSLFFFSSIKVIRALVIFIPIDIIGPFFNFLRIKWKSISRSTKRKGLDNYKVIIK